MVIDSVLRTADISYYLGNVDVSDLAVLLEERLQIVDVGAGRQAVHLQAHHPGNI